MDTFHKEILPNLSTPKYKPSRDRLWVVERQNNKLLGNLLKINNRENQYFNDLPRLVQPLNIKKLQREQEKEYARFKANVDKVGPVMPKSEWIEHMRKTEKFGGYFR